MILNLEEEIKKKRKRKPLTPEQLERKRANSREFMRKWRAEHPEENKKRQRKYSTRYRLKNMDECKAKSLDNYHKNREERNAKSLDYYYKNREKVLKRMKEKRERDKRMKKEEV